MNELRRSIRDAIYQKAEDLGLATQTIRDTDHLSLTTIDHTIAITIQLQKLLVRLGTTLPKQGTQK